MSRYSEPNTRALIAAPRRGIPIAERLRHYAPPLDVDQCWEWRGHRGQTGYGKVHFRGAPAYAHRVAFELWNGPIPAQLYVLHLCHNRCCVNPAHLRLGTQSDNMRDMVVAGRSAAGEKNPSAKMTAATAREIYGAAGSQRQIAARFGFSPSTVQQIKERKKWRRATADLAGKSSVEAGEPAVSAAIHDGYDGMRDAR